MRSFLEKWRVGEVRGLSLLVFSVQFSGKRKRKMTDQRDGVLGLIGCGGDSMLRMRPWSMAESSRVSLIISREPSSRFEIEGLLDALTDVELGAEFAAGAFADAEEADEILRHCRVRHPQRCSTESKSPSAASDLSDRKFFESCSRDTNIDSKLTSAFPNFQIFKGSCSHGFLFFLPEN